VGVVVSSPRPLGSPSSTDRRPWALYPSLPRTRLHIVSTKPVSPCRPNSAGASSGQVEFHFVVNVKAPPSQYNGPLLMVATTQYRRPAGNHAGVQMECHFTVKVKAPSTPYDGALTLIAEAG